jgi:hypothetical protein
MKLESICKNCSNNCLNTPATRSIEINGLTVGILAVNMKVVGYLKAEILTKTLFTAAILPNPRWLQYRTQTKWKHWFFLFML